ncbi:MAG: RecQ family ATP-dependent DNA helicase [Verrucomicrobia bacterium]|nr:RecQ family ATP-dependent DNA helicase [Verrucomicrobiota bacterium]
MENNHPYQTLLKQHFGFEEFRPGQLEAIQALLEHHRLLCIQPTGYGKSLLYQFPSCLLPGITLVISPLLALMRDQIEHLTQRFHIPAASLNSDQTDEENARAREQAGAGKLKILFVSPEQLDHIDRFNFLRTLPISLLVIDEAHCISTWGHDFRPSYRQILHFIQALESESPDIKILGLTATADPRVETDIQRQLSSARKPLRVLRESMDRPNIHLSVIPSQGIASKLFLCQTLLSRLEGSGLIYCATRESAELVAEYLQQQGLSTTAYHAGLDPEEKRKIQTAFSQNQYKVVAATSALGMGIDKGDLRFIIHFDIPGSITAYYQEVGRCGRDGSKAEGILFYDPADRKIQEYFIDAALPTAENFEAVRSFICSAQAPPNLTKIKQVTGLHPTRVTLVIAELMEQQFLKKESLKGSQVYLPHQPLAALDLSRYTTQHLVKTEELQKMVAYAEQREQCRMALLRKALGDQKTESCGHCDGCLKTLPKEKVPAEALARVQAWLSNRPIPIAETRTYRISAGFSLLDGRLRTPLFVRFMQQRASSQQMDEELLALLKKQASLLSPVAAVVPLPSQTWKSRREIAAELAKHLQVEVADILSWKTCPEKRQGELLNNDQRHQNVAQQMQVEPAAKIPEGPLLLLDDYMGSGATMKEAARALRQVTGNPLVPFTIASIKWHLGKPGFV